MATTRVPFRDTGAELKRMVLQQAAILEQAQTYRALEVAYHFATRIAPVLTGKARWGINPSAGAPRALEHPDGTYPPPGDDRLIGIRVQLGNGVHAFLVFHAHGSDGAFDYAGILLDVGWSAQAPFGVMRPTKMHVEANAEQISRMAVQDTLRAIGG